MPVPYGAQIAQKPNTTYFKNLPYPALDYIQLIPLNMKKKISNSFAVRKNQSRA